MEDHLNDKNRLDKDWNELCLYEADRDDAFSGKDELNMSKNRYSNILPYDHNRVKLGAKMEQLETDYINASFIVSIIEIKYRIRLLWSPVYTTSHIKLM